MPQTYDWTGFGVRVRCRHEAGPDSLLVWRSQWTPQVIRIETPTVYNRTAWTIEQARQLRDVLDAAIRAGERS
ncbi:hypothetical protein CDG81_20760 [Actinopolyspora erythraea]|uniref:Uncharacterized protein n=2 Tax=Actinopolyspora TaxID=1849 RepID=A0A099DB73_9ACTN|nr:hypothetical protein CDG81_20760 [Actinopolyspora erythraea]KGI82620.1 hypothetical protein IL38_04120 [Actinopolyspora erythraea]SDP87273.1 hypothetical protein SAMN04487905_11180 [Actinopolyspora xinjiangensis]